MVDFISNFVEIAKETWNEQYTNVEKIIFKVIGVGVTILVIGVIIQFIVKVIV